MQIEKIWELIAGEEWDECRKEIPNAPLEQILYQDYYVRVFCCV